MPKFQLKSEPLAAIEWTGKNFKAVDKLFPNELRVKNDRLYNPTDMGLMEIQVGDYLLENGMVVSAEYFEANYEEAK